MNDSDLVEALARFGTPTISNALECLGEAPDVGYTDATVLLQSPDTPAFVGHAVTARITTARPQDQLAPPISTEEYWRYVASRPGPKIVVSEDTDPVADAAMWGEVQGRLHRAMGVTGIVTNGGVRDVAELARLGFGVLAGRVCVSHAYARFLELDVPVLVGGLTVMPGDLLHADRHGAQRIPAHVRLDALLDTATRIEALEGELFVAAASFDAGLPGFLDVWSTVRARWPRAEGPAGDTAV